MGALNQEKVACNQLIGGGWGLCPGTLQMENRNISCLSQKSKHYS